MPEPGPLSIDALRSPDAYPHPVVAPVRLLETHISWVLLTGPYAYKIKKPLRLSFLDYSALDLRRAYCREELRLNRRYAPDLYLDVVSIGGAADAPRVDATGPALEYAVRMRQFDPADELGALLADNRVQAEELATLGRHVAEFHARAERVADEQPYGRPERVHRVTLDNFAELRRLPESGPWATRLQALEDWVQTAFELRRSLMGRRRDTGRVRECHGDLHCANVVRWNGALTPFDGIEFDPALRFVDVMNDLAFLTMDLAAHGRADLRHAVLQAWTETLGDYGGLPLLPYFETYRALVRAKVAALRALQAPAADREHVKAVHSAEHYLDWAEERIRRRPPRLLITCGLSGSGKTWLARGLAATLPALHVRSDVERKRLAGLAPLEDSRSPPDGGIYTLEFNERTYRRLRDCAHDALAGGETVIVDAAFLRRAERRSLLSLAQDLAVDARILHCQAPADVLRQRVAERARRRLDPSEAGPDVLARQPGYWEDFDETEQPHVIAVDTAAPGVVDELSARLTQTTRA